MEKKEIPNSSSCNNNLASITKGTCSSSTGTRYIYKHSVCSTVVHMQGIKEFSYSHSFPPLVYYFFSLNFFLCLFIFSFPRFSNCFSCCPPVWDSTPFRPRKSPRAYFVCYKRHKNPFFFLRFSFDYYYILLKRKNYLFFFLFHPVGFHSTIWLFPHVLVN